MAKMDEKEDPELTSLAPPQTIIYEETIEKNNLKTSKKDLLLKIQRRNHSKMGERGKD